MGCANGKRVKMEEGQEGFSKRIRRSVTRSSEKRNIDRLNNYLLNEKIAAINDVLPVCCNDLSRETIDLDSVPFNNNDK